MGRIRWDHLMAIGLKNCEKALSVKQMRPSWRGAFEAWLGMIWILCSVRSSNGWGWLMLGKWNSIDFSLPCNATYCVNLPSANTSRAFTLHRCLGIGFWEEQFTYESNHFIMSSTVGVSSCLDVVGNGPDVGLTACDSTSKSQNWTFSGTKLQNGQGVYLLAPAPLAPYASNIPVFVGVLNQSTLSDWTFMDSSNLQEYKPALPASRYANLVSNGQFLENWGGIQVEGSPGDMTLICSWTISGNSKTYLIREKVSDWSVNWDVKPDAITQAVPTYSGLAHILKFDVKGNSTCAANGQASNKILVSLSCSSSESNIFEVNNSGGLWEAKEVRFLAKSATVNLTITNLENYGICFVITNVEVSLDDDSSSATKFRKRILVLSVLAAFFGAVTMVVVAMFYLISRNRKFSRALHRKISVSENMCALSVRRRTQRFTYAYLYASTDGFAAKNSIGSGGYANVYKGVTPDGYVIAIKKAFKLQPDVEFNHEVNMLDRVHHRRLVPFIGYCDENGAEQILVFEYMGNGSLYNQLHDPHRSVISLDKRFKIAQDVAQGLEYLHHGANPPIIHRDVKSANVLLDENFSAKVADFGIFKLGYEDTSRALSLETNVKGSYGYMDPRQMDSGTISTKSDVYSFGVVLLELVTGRKAIEEESLLSDWAKGYYGQDTEALNNMVDLRLKMCFDPGQVKLLVCIAQQCLLPNREDRPSMSEVVRMLSVESRSQGGIIIPLQIDGSSTSSGNEMKRGSVVTKHNHTREETQILETASLIQSCETNISEVVEGWIDVHRAAGR